MHRALSCVKFMSNLHFGLHVNSLGWKKATTKTAKADMAKMFCYRKQNHFYSREQRPQPRNGSDSPFFMDASYACLTGRNNDIALNPSRLVASFIAINIEDEPVESVAAKAKKLLGPYVGSVDRLPVFVPLRALRSIALSRKRWIERKGEKSIMASGFRSTNAEVWADHYRCVKNGRTASGVEVVGLHYSKAVQTAGQSVVDAFSSSTSGLLETMSKQPQWVKHSVLSDGHGSSFVGSGNSKGPEIRKSLAERAGRLSEFSEMFNDCPEAAEHAERFGEL